MRLASHATQWWSDVDQTNTTCLKCFLIIETTLKVMNCYQTIC